MSNLIIGINGSAGSGKTTFAEYLKYLIIKSGLYDNCILVPFAKALKDFARLLGWNSKKDEKGRKLLQLLGTEVARECIHNDIWIKHWLFEINKIKFPAIIICDDMRFRNEILKINQLRGITIKIKGRGYSNIDTSHESEKIFPDNDFNYIIDNSKTLLDLKHQAQGFIDEVL